MTTSSPAPTAEAAQLLREAGRALSLGQSTQAEALLDRLLARDPAQAEAHRLRGIAALMSGHHPLAITHLRQALAMRPDDATVHMTLGNALFETGDIEASLTSLRRASELAPGMAAAWYNLGRALQLCARMEPAGDALRRAVAIEPAHLRARNALAAVLTSLGDIAAAVALLRETLRQQPDNAEAWLALSNIKTESLSHADTGQLQQLFRRPDLPDDARIQLGFTLAKALEDQADYAAAFEAVREANALKRRTLYWSRDEERTRVDAIASAFAAPQPAPLDASLGQEIIFIVSLPRAGSTLAEQILASHPEVTGGDEFQALPEILDEESARRGLPFPQWVPAATAADWHRLGQDYLARAAPWRPGHQYLTDKNISNWAFVGAALAMLPAARVVNARRDLLETCFAGYRQLFTTGVHFSYDLDDMVAYCAGYERLSARWRQRYPQHFLDHDYESLQREPEAQIRRLLDFCGLPFDPACLAFHQTARTVLTFSAAQVRQPLRQDTARAAHYGDKLAPLRSRLQAAGLLAVDG